jgi:hypothetical protein
VVTPKRALPEPLARRPDGVRYLHACRTPMRLHLPLRSNVKWLWHAEWSSWPDAYLRYALCSDHNRLRSGRNGCRPGSKKALTGYV